MPAVGLGTWRVLEVRGREEGSRLVSERRLVPLEHELIEDLSEP